VRHKGELASGRGLRRFGVSDAERLERMLPVLAYAYLLLLLTGLVCGRKYSQAWWSSAVGKRRQSSAFVIGRYMTGVVKLPLREMFKLLATLLSQTTKENRG